MKKFAIKKKILVTGGTGMIGSHLLRRLVADFEHPIVFMRRNSCVSRIKDIMHKLQIERVDLLDKNDLLKKIKLYNPKIIFHLASSYFNPPDLNITDHFKINLKGTINLLESIKEIKNVRFIYTGSQAQYEQSDFMSEDSPSIPDSVYGVSKQSASLISRVLCQKYDIQFFELRLFTPFGEWEKSSRLIPYVVNSILTKKQIVIRTRYAQGDYTYITDVIEGLVKVSNLKYNNNLLINICSGKFISVDEVVNKILKVMNKKINVKFLDSSPKNNFKRKSSNLLAKENIGWSPKVSFEKGLKNTVEDC